MVHRSELLHVLTQGRWTIRNPVRYPIAIKIVRVPDGEAPADIRRSFFGLVLPARKPDAADRPLRILSRNPVLFKEYFAVSAKVIVDLLERDCPLVAAWLVEHAPYIGDKEFAFNAVSVKVLE